MRTFLSCILLALLLAACTGPAETPPLQTSPTPALPLNDCLLSSPGLATQVAAKCAALAVPEDRTNPAGRQLNLNVVVIKALSSNPAADPLFLLAGGPGQAASEAYLPLIPLLDKIAFKHDLVLVDQRGTGKSNPLHCESEDAQDITDTGFPQPEEITTAFNDCLAKIDADTRFYTTAAFVADLEAVRLALGYAQIDLLGVSYGTRSALDYLKTYPQNVRAVILDARRPTGLVHRAVTAPGCPALHEPPLRALRRQSGLPERLSRPERRPGAVDGAARSDPPDRHPPAPSQWERGDRDG